MFCLRRSFALRAILPGYGIVLNLISAFLNSLVALFQDRYQRSCTILCLRSDLDAWKSMAGLFNSLSQVDVSIVSVSSQEKKG